MEDEIEVDDENSPNKPLDSTKTKKGINLTNIVEKLIQGVRLSNLAKVTNITKDALLRPT